MKIQAFLYSGIETINGVIFAKKSTLILYNPETISNSYMIPDGVENIAPDAFRGHEELTNIILPDSLKHIGEDAFRDCKGLVSITLSNGIEQIDCGAFEDCTNLTSINIPDSVQYIGHDTFDGCHALVEVEYKGKTYNTILCQSHRGYETRDLPTDFYNAVNNKNQKEKF